jgi:hypothetical protein
MKGQKMKHKFRILRSALLLLLLNILLIENTFAQTSGTTNTNSSFKFSFQERVRLETWDNTVTLSRAAKAGSSYLRNKTSIMGQWLPTEALEIGVKLTNEFRTYFSPSTNVFHMNEVFFDQLYIKWNTKAVLDGILTVGRQNLNFGEGFVVLEGTPLDGSRATYFNAVKYDWNLNKDNTISLFGLYMPLTDDLPVINGNDIDAAFLVNGTWGLTEQKENGFGLYYTGKLSWGNIQAYYIRKNYLSPNKAIGQIDSDVNTVGGRINKAFSKELSFTFEGAYQFGKYGDFNKNAYGGYLYLDYKPTWNKVYLPKTFTIGSICLSGDDPGTKDNEGWDPIFSRWPKWSDSYVYTLVKESKVAYWSNMVSIYSSVKFIIDEQVSFSFDYHHLLALQTGTATSFLSGNGHVRGDLFIAKMLLEINKYLSGHFIFEHFLPGNYYVGTADSANFARFEMTVKL